MLRQLQRHPFLPSLPVALLLGSLAVGMAAVLPLAEVRAQQSEAVRFRPGDYGTMLSGSLQGRSYVDYRLSAQAGQELFAELSVDRAQTNGHGTVYFNVLPPGSSGEAIVVGSMQPENWIRINLPSSGEYTIRLYLMGNDRDTDKTVAYRLDLSIQ